jgi:endonuclease I
VYYAKAIGEKKEGLKSALHSIIAKADVLDYGKGSADKTWAGFYKTDRIIGTNEVRDRYSNDHRYFDVSNPYAAVSGMNIEHSLANSWWGGSKNQAYKDIHHLMPCQTTINSSKGNYGMGKVTTAKTDNGCTKVGTGPGAGGNSIQLWEPADKWKGDFARVYFYMVTCYEEKLPDWYDNYSDSRPTLDGSTYPGFQTWQLKMLMEWADKDPVSEKEINRNNAVYDIQENRNPFIDYPGLEEYVWGSMTDVAFSYDHYVRPEDYSGIITGVVSFDETKPNTIIYDLQGRKVGTTVNGTPHLKKGVYIMSGRKVIAN